MCLDEARFVAVGVWGLGKDRSEQLGVVQQALHGLDEERGKVPCIRALARENLRLGKVDVELEGFGEVMVVFEGVSMVHNVCCIERLHLGDLRRHMVISMP